MSTKKTKTTKSIHPIAAEFQAACKAIGFTDEEAIQNFIPLLCQNDTQLRLVNINISSNFGKALSRLIHKYNKFQIISFYACPILDFSFFKQLPSDLLKTPLQQLAFDFAPIPREYLIPFLTLPIDSLSFRGNKCLTSYDYQTHEKNPFPASLNLFFNTLCASTIKALNLFGCHIGDDGANALAETLFFNTTLRCISLSSNRITDIGAVALASALGNYYLNDSEVLVVERMLSEESKQKISDEGGNLMKKKKGGPAKPPPKKPPQKLQKNKNQFAKMSLTDKIHSFDPSAPVAPHVFTKWMSVQTDSEGRKYIPGNITLTSLVLDDNRIGQQGLEALKEMLTINQMLKLFSIQDNPEISSEDSASIQRIPTVDPVSPQ